MPIVGELALQCNTTDEIKARNAEINGRRDVRRFSTEPSKEGHVVVVGGGPSLADDIESIRKRQEQGQLIWATNNTFKFLTEHGIKPNAHVILDSRPENVNFLQPTRGVTYYLHVSCDPSLYEVLRVCGCDVVMYSLDSEATGTTVGLKAMYLAGYSGYKNFHLYGFDSSYRDNQHHAYVQSLNDTENVIEVTVEGRKFKCAPWMLIQVEEFQQIAASFADQDCVITVAGDGLLPFVAHRLARLERTLTAVWDLARCPPTYDITSFLGECELRRRELGCEWIDVVFQPGPIGGFRDDELPPNLGSRVGMLYRVAVAMCRLLPSVRNIEILKTRRRIEGEEDCIFPVGYRVDAPIAHYGPSYVNRAEPVLRATEVARNWVKKQGHGRYVTITLREATHWPTRNSNVAEWEKVGAWLEAQGFKVVWVRDTEHPKSDQYSWDLDLRVALYEGAVLNLGINNGPTFMWLYCDVSYIIFKCVTEDIYWTSREFFARFDIKEGVAPGNGRGRLVFEPDNYETIIAEVSRYFVGSLQEAA